ncbi:PepSY-associated TM helix domain-containing protein [Leptospira sp. 96542]|nr:PepSY-associated TM helix domain-containing protein [Leptospira sp. 96542]
MKAKTWYKMHTILGVFGATFLLVLGITGSLLVYGIELQALIDPNPISAETNRLSFDELYKRFLTQTPEGSVAGWLKSDLENQPDQIWFHDKTMNDTERVYLLNPYTGKVAGTLKDDRSDSLYGFLLVLHYSLFLGGVGYFITGCFAFIYLLLAISGIRLYRNFWKSLFRLRFKESFRMMFSDIHKFIGINFIWFHLILAITGGWWSLRDTVILEFPEEKLVYGLWSENNSIDRLIDETKKQIPGFSIGYIAFPHHSKTDPIGFYGNRIHSSSFESRYGSFIQYDTKTNRIMRMVDISKASIADQILDSFRPLHFGTFANHISKIIWVFCGLSPAVLAISGLCIFYSKFKDKKKRTQKLVSSSLH